MKDIDKPNLVLPLAASYNQRQDQNLTAITVDQRKVNSIYESVVNSMTGSQTLYLSKRPGFGATEDMGSAGDVSYLAIPAPVVSEVMWAACVSTSTLRVKNITGTATTLSTAANIFPAYFDRTAISGIQYAVLQAYNSSTLKFQTWYASTLATWFEITDADFPTSAIGKMEHIDGYALQMTSTNRIHNSDLNSISSWPATGFITKSIEQDVGRGLARYKNMVLAFGMETVEVYYNAGYATGSPLERLPQFSARVGLSLSPNDTSPEALFQQGSRHYYATLDNKLYFTGREGGMGLVNRGIYAFDGQRFYRISTPVIDRLFRNVAPQHIGVLNVMGQQGIAFAVGGPTASTQQWAMYFPKWNDWFEWNSVVVQPVSDGTRVLGIGGKSGANTLFQAQNTPQAWVDWSASTYQWQHTFTLPTNGEYQQMRMAGVVGDTARSTQSLGVEFSDDDYQSWRTADSIDMTAEKKRIYRQGGFHQRAVRLTYTGSLDIRLQKFVAKVTE